jgi:REP-associated tyrosine transposase
VVLTLKETNKIYLGDDDFVEDAQCKITADINLDEVPSSQKRPVAKPLSHYKEISTSRNEAIDKAYKSGVYSMKEIDDFFAVHYSTVSKILKSYSDSRPDPMTVTL